VFDKIEHPKKEKTERMGEYRSISLVHSMAKIFFKIFTNRLVPRLSELVSSSQSASSINI
jgi:hypothetical protein